MRHDRQVHVREIRARYSAGTVTVYQAYPTEIARPAELRTSPVRVQWDPERSLHLQPLPYRSLQAGLSGEAVDRYIDEWIVGITDITPAVHEIRGLLRAGDDEAARGRLPDERRYPLPAAVGAVIGASAPDPGPGVAGAI